MPFFWASACSVTAVSCSMYGLCDPAPCRTCISKSIERVQDRGITSKFKQLVNEQLLGQWLVYEIWGVSSPKLLSCRSLTDCSCQTAFHESIRWNGKAGWKDRHKSPWPSHQRQLGGPHYHPLALSGRHYQILSQGYFPVCSPHGMCRSAGTSPLTGAAVQQ